MTVLIVVILLLLLLLLLVVVKMAMIVIVMVVLVVIGITLKTLIMMRVWLMMLQRVLTEETLVTVAWETVHEPLLLLLWNLLQ